MPISSSIQSTADSNRSVPQIKSRSKSGVSPKTPRYFFTASAALLFALTVYGFQHFYFQGKAYPGRELTPPIRNLLIIHGTAMAVWILLFLVQPLLIATGGRRMHMLLGKFGAALAAVVVIFGILVGIGAARSNPPDLLLWNLNPRQFLAISLISILTFGVFVAIGIWARKRPDIHRPMMLLAVLAAMPAALDRIDPIRTIYESTFLGPNFGPFFWALVIGFVLLVLFSLLTRSINRWFAAGFASLFIIDALVMQLAPSRLWDAIAAFLLG